MVDPYRAPRPEPPPPRDVMRVVLYIAGGLAALIAATAIAFYVIEQQQGHAAKSEPSAHPVQEPREPPTTSHALVEHVPPNTNDCCAQKPNVHCAKGVEPTCVRNANGTCGWKIPAECTFELPYPNAPIPPDGGRYPQLNELLDTR